MWSYRLSFPRAKRVFVCAAIWFGCAASSPAQPVELLDEAVTRFFLKADPDQRKSEATRIANRPDATVESVRGVLSRINLWMDQPAGLTRFLLPNEAGDPQEITVRVPADYDPQRRYPLIIALHGMGDTAGRIIAYYVRLLGDRAEEFIFAAPQDYVGYLFQSTIEEAQQPRKLLLELRKRYRIDSQRIYITGYSMGGHSTFGAAVHWPDDYAAAIPIAGSFVAMPYEQVRTLMFSNLAHTPMLLVWGQIDNGDGKGGVDPGGGIAGTNRRLIPIFDEMDLPVTAVEIPDVGHGGVLPDRDQFLEFVSKTRVSPLKEISYWFRYPAQGRRDWLRIREFSGEPWTGTTFRIQVRPGEDVDEHILKTLEGFLAYMGGRIDGQRIELETRHLKEVEVLLYDGMIDFGQPVEIYYNRKVRFNDVATPKVETLLETAYEEWEFQQLPSARIIVSRTGPAHQS